MFRISYYAVHCTVLILCFQFYTVGQKRHLFIINIAATSFFLVNKDSHNNAVYCYETFVIFGTYTTGNFQLEDRNRLGSPIL